MAQTGVAKNVRTAVLLLGANGSEFTLQALAEQTDYILPRDRRRMNSAVRDMVKSGELVRVRQATYQMGRTATRSATIAEAMWHTLRLRRVVTVEDLMELAGATENYAKEWLQMLVRRELAKRLDNGCYQLTVDEIEMPGETDNAVKLREMRRAKKEIRAGLDAMSEAIGRVRTALDKI